LDNGNMMPLLAATQVEISGEDLSRYRYDPPPYVFKRAGDIDMADKENRRRPRR
jgi:hypothetical protein